MEKCVRTVTKTMVLDRKKKHKALALPCLAWGPLPNAANFSDLPTKFATELKKEKVLKDKFWFVTCRLPLLQHRY